MHVEAESRCPNCGGEGVPLLFGRVGPEASAAAKAGLLRLAGCFVPDEPPNWACRAGHTWRDVTDPRGWDVRLINVLEAHGYRDHLDLDDLKSEVEDRTETWRQARATWDIVVGRPTDNPSMSVMIETPDAVGQLTLWESGEAEIVWAGVATSEAPSQEHYSLRSRTGLRECLYDLETRLGLNEQSL